jgi:hypothetical protein
METARENAEHLQRVKALNRRLSKGALQVLKFLAVAGMGTPEVISIATGYKLKTLEFKILPELSTLGLVKRWEGRKRTVIFKSNLFVLTSAGTERAGVKRRKVSFFVNLWHRELVSEVIAFFFRRFKEAGESVEIHTEGQWKAFAEQKWKSAEGLPIPDIFWETGGVLTCIEVETGRSWKRLQEKVFKYNALREKYEGVLNVIFIFQNVKNKRKKENFEKRFAEVKPLIKFTYLLKSI